MKQSLSPNSLAFIALCNEYCAVVEHAPEGEEREFVESMIRQLPRLYISANDLQIDNPEPDAYINEALDEDYYDSVRRGMEAVLGEDDGYLEVFEEDMKYSDAPIAASVSETLADIFQVLYNFIDTVKDAPTDIVEGALGLVKDDFNNYWSQLVCNVLRPLNVIKTSRF